MHMSALPVSLRPLLSGAATAGLAMGLSSVATPAVAQSADPAKSPKPGTSAPDALVLDPVNVDAATPAEPTANVNATSTGMSRLPASVKETPRVINVVPEEIIQQQKATSLEQVLRNVPGITVSTGEGNGGQQGDQFRIRGLSAKGDLYSDGLKDFGVYTHDVFNTESVQVLKGPSGDGFGVGNSGGLINQSSKQAKLENSYAINQSVGSGPTYRTTLDLNQKINASTALRVNALYHDQEVADRDWIDVERKGFAADLGVGLNGPTTWHLNYAYLKGDQTPDHGVPMLRDSNGKIKPATEYGLDRSTSYARNLDRDITENHTLTSRLNHEVDSSLSFYNDTRWSMYERDFAITTPSTLASVADLAGALSYGAGGGMAYQQDGWGVQNISGVKAEGVVLGLRHKAHAGLDINYQEDGRRVGTWVNRTNNQTVQNPSHYYTGGAYLTYPDSGVRSSSATDLGLFLSDRVWLMDQVSVVGGLRVDHFRTSFRAQSSAISNGQDETDTVSPSASVIYEPTKDASLYASYSHSVKPVGVDIAAAVNNGTNETPNGSRSFDPEETDLYEIGAKADFLGGRLGLNGAVFLIEKSNTYAVDSTTGALQDGFGEAGQGTRVSGFEMGISGKITPSWNIYANYAMLMGEITASVSSPQNVGKDAPNVPENNLSLWTSYVLSDLIGDALPGKLTAGGGIQYVSGYYIDANNYGYIPQTFSLDAMLSYEWDVMNLSLNGYNLTDNLNYSAATTGRAVPTSGRTVMLNAGLKF